MNEQRHLKFHSIGELITELQQLQRGCRSIGQWSLPQAAWHLSLALRSVKPVPAGTTSTPEQTAAKRSRLDYLLNGGPMGSGAAAPAGMDPLKDFPAAADATAVDAYIAGLEALDRNTQPEIAFGRFGLVTIDEFKRFMLIHAAHHLNKLIPTT